ncbi:MAG: hypothetical protein AB7P52_02440 [Alphaproteobacteria bacterium]
MSSRNGNVQGNKGKLREKARSVDRAPPDGQTRRRAEPVSLAPLKFEEAVGGLLKVKPGRRKLG